MIERHFDSALAMARYIEETAPIPGANNSSWSNPADDFTRHQTWAEAREILLHRGGYWREGADAIMGAHLKIEGELSRAPKVAFKRDYAGSRPHVPAHLAGSPKSMVRKVRQPRPTPVLRIGVNIGMTGDDDEQEAFNRGAALLGAVRSIEESGTRVELVAVSLVNDRRDIYGDSRNFLMTITLKKAGDRLSVGDLSYITCHCNALRRHGFAVREREPDFYRLSNAAYGLSIECPKTDKFDVMIPKIGDGRYATPHRALNFVTKIIENQTK